jgi:hypothetical protein
MQFKRHLFISYTHKDNKPLFDDAEGWVSRFHKTLGVVLEQRLGRPPEIWRDERLQGNDVFTPEIMAKLPESAVLLAVVSEGYVSSKWCCDEAQAFCEAAERTGGLTRDNKSRVFKVFKAPPASLEPLPPVMREMTGYNFFERNAENAPKELDPDFDKASRAKYVDQIMTLAFHLTSLIQDLEADVADEQGAAGTEAARPLVYLAECDHDRSADRGQLAIDLAARGYRVLPDRELPRGEAAYRQAVEEALARCALAVHLVGNHSGWAPEGPSLCPAVELQNAESAARARAGGLRRVVSLPAGVQGSDERQQQFIHALHHDPQVQAGELITADREAVKKAVLDTLTAIEKPPPEAPVIAGGKVVYLVCDPRDSDAADPIGEWLAERGCKVRLPAFPPDAQAARLAHEQRLAQCDAVLVFYGAGTKDWYAGVLSDVARAPSLRQGRPIATVYTWLAPDESFDKSKRIDREEPRLINGLSGSDAALAAPFLAAVTEAAAHD